MITYGNYELVDELYRTEFGLVGTVRSLDGKDVGDRMIKVFDPTVGDERARASEAESFMERARLQRSLAPQKATHWQRVHEIAAQGPGVAYYIADYHALSAQKLIDGRVEMSSGSLHRLVSGAVRGLSELKLLRGRAHGDLKPGNVLVVGNGDLSRAKVVLCDPAAPSLAASNGESGDLYAIGALVHELVLHRQFDGGTIWPLAPDPAWAQLGRKGKSWRSLCNDLLAQTPRGEGRTFKRLSGAIDGLSPRRRFSGRPLQVAVLLALLAMTFAAYALVGFHEQRAFSKAHQEWIADFAKATADPARRRRYSADPTLNDVMRRVDGLNAAAVKFGEKPHILMLPAEFRATRAAMAGVHEIEDDLTPPHWERMRLLMARQREFDARGWQQPTDFVNEVLKAASPASNASLARAIDHLLDLQDAIIGTAPEADTAWGHLEDSCNALEATGDVLLIASSQAIRASGATAVSLDLRGLHGAEQLNAVADLGVRLAGAMASSTTGAVDFNRFAVDFRRGVQPASLTTTQIERWLNKLGAYSVRQDKIDDVVALLHQRLENVAGQVTASNPAETDKVLFGVERKKVEARIDKFRQSPVIDADVREGSLTRTEASFSRDIDGLLRYRRPENPLVWIRQLPELHTGSDRIDEYWLSWKRVLPNRMPENTTDNATFDFIKKGTDRLLAALRDLDAAFPAAPSIAAGERSEAFASAARQRREQAIDGILQALKQGPSGFDIEPWKAAGVAYGDWLVSLSALSKDFPLRDSLLSADDRPDLKWQKLNAAFWNDSIVQNLVAPDMLRIRRLDAMRQSARDSLSQAAQEDPAAEVILAAWKQLGADRIDPPWPSQAGELDAEAKIRRRLSDALKGVAPADQSAAEQVLNRQASLRWRRAVEHADDQKTLASALELRKIFGIDSAEYRKLGPEARFNLALFAVHQQLRRGGDDDAALKELIDALKSSVDELKGQHGTSDLLFKLAGLDRAESFDGDQHGDYFRPQIFGVSMEFKLVSLGHVRPYYLSTREVSFDDFVKLISAARLWKNVRSLPLGQPANAPDTVRGPCVWEWTAQNAVPLGLSEFWLPGGERGNDFPPSLRISKFNRSALSDESGGSPNAEHPMQQISAQAALYFASVCGCRLPTTREWQGARTLFEKDVPPDRWNLRDRTWETYHRYGQALANPELRSGDSGIFIPAGSSVATGSAAKSGQQDDHTLFFRHVSGDVEAGGTFKHLVGNVAEFVNDAPGQLDETLGVLSLGVTNNTVAEGARAAQIAKFSASAKDKLGVIGGSSLSPPEVPVDKVQRIARTDLGYSDVGLRLAFTAPAKDLRERLRWVLEEQPYLWRASLLEVKQKPADAGAAPAAAAKSSSIADP